MKWILIAYVTAGYVWAGKPDHTMVAPAFEDRAACVAAGEALQIMAKGSNRVVSFICAPTKMGVTQ